MNNILVFGASSAIAKEYSRRAALSGAGIFLVGRRKEDLDNQAHDLMVRGASSVQIFEFDFLNSTGIDELIEKLFTKEILFQQILIAHGILIDETKFVDTGTVTKLIETNYSSAVKILNRIVQKLDLSQETHIGVISSVAGDRGRASNCLYGSSKAALSIYVNGLTHRYSQSKIYFVDFHLGFVDTPMTTSYKKGLLWASSDQVGESIYGAMSSRKRGKVYLPWFWYLIMMIIRNLPQQIFWKLKI